MTPEPSDPGLAPAQASRGAPLEGVIVLLLDALQKLANAGEVDAACRIAGKACVLLRQTSPRAEQRFNALLHRLAHRLGPVGRKDIDA
jgi:hypothetical protein